MREIYQKSSGKILCENSESFYHFLELQGLGFEL